MDDHVARRKRIFGPGMLVVGAVVYPWDCGRCHTLSEKGYFFCGNRHVWFSSLNSPEHTEMAACFLVANLCCCLASAWSRSAYLTALAGALKILCLVALGSVYMEPIFTLPTVMMNDGRSHHCRLANPFPFINTL